MEYCEIPLEQIDFEDATFRISEELDPPLLLESIREAGLLYPAIVLLAGGRYTIVCGFRRLRALGRLGASSAPARVVESQGGDFPELFDRALWDNLSHRSLEPVETARVLYKLKHDFGMPDGVLTERYLPRLGLPAHAQSLRVQMMVHATSGDVRELFRRGRLTLASLERLSEMFPASRGAVASALGKMRLSASLQRQFFGLLRDLAAVAGTGPEQVLRDARVSAVVDDARLSPAERGEGACAMLYRLRYPRVARARERFAECRRSLGLPGTVRLTADPYFETPDLRLEFTARDAERFRRLAADVYAASRRPELDRLFEIDCI